MQLVYFGPHAAARIPLEILAAYVMGMSSMVADRTFSFARGRQFQLTKWPKLRKVPRSILRKCWNSGANNPSTLATSGVKLTCRISHAAKYFRFFSSSAALRTCNDGELAYGRASVAVTRISNDACCCGCHTPVP